MPDEVISVHDNRLLSYEVNCREQRILLRTCYEEGQPAAEFTNVIFEGVCAYSFHHDCLAHGNIVFDIERVELRALVTENEQEFLAGRRHGWPPVGSFETIPDLMQHLEALNVHVYEISSSMGLDGFVIARTMHLVPINPGSD